MSAQFHLTADHLALLKHANVTTSRMEWGSPGIDPKRPFGNSEVTVDVARILGWEMIDTDAGPALPNGATKKAAELLADLRAALEIVLSTQSFVPGVYVESSWRVWTLVRSSEVAR